MSERLRDIRQKYEQQASLLLEACVQRNKEHTLLKSGICNAGKWRSEWMKIEPKNIKTDKAAIFCVLLATNEAVERKGKISQRVQFKQENLWPWCNRDTVLSQAKTVEWLEILLALDEKSTIFVDIIPDLGIWVCDIFNYIPRDIWTVAARLLARLYRSSKKLFLSLYPEVSEDSEKAKDSFFFSKIDDSLKELFDFSREAKNKGSIRTVFCEKDDANQRYGEHSHVHRHSLYLLFQVALLDSDWYGIIFDVSQKVFQKHFSKITDASCLSVFYPALLDLCYFTGHRTTLDWSLVLRITGVESLQISSLPDVHTQPHAHWQGYAAKVIRKNVLKRKALNTNIQLVVEFFNVYKRNSYESTHEYAVLFQEVIAWICSVDADASWQEYSYDMLAFYIDEVHSFPRSSLFEERSQELCLCNPTQRRHILISSYRSFIFQEKYALLCEDERKQLFFDLWFLLKEDDVFSESFGTHLLEKGEDLVFFAVQGMHGSLLDSVRSLFSPKDLGKKEYTKIMLLLAILIHGQNLSVHQNELANLIRDASLKRILVFDTNEQSNFFTQGTKDLSSVGPIAVWLLNNQTFRGYETPIVYQIIQHFLMECRSETQKLHFFWRVGLFDPNDSIYKNISKNLQFPYHVLGEKPVQYTKIDWNLLSCTLKDQISHRKSIYKEYQKISEIEELQKKEIYDNMVNSFLSFFSLWGENLRKYKHLFAIQEEINWPETQWKQLVEFWRTWMSREEPRDFFELDQCYNHIHDFFDRFISLLNNIIHDVHLELIQNYKKTFMAIYEALRTGKDEKLEADRKIFIEYSPIILSQKLPKEISLLFEDIFLKIQKTIEGVIHKEKIYQQWDKDILSQQLSFANISFYLSSGQGYWYHTKKHFETYTLEKILSQSWIDSFEPKWMEDSFSEGIRVFAKAIENYPEDKSIPWVVLSTNISQNKGIFEGNYIPLLKKTLEESSDCKDYLDRLYQQWDKGVFSKTVSWTHLQYYFSSEEYWKYVKDPSIEMFKDFKIEEIVVQSWLDDFASTLTKENYEERLKDFKEVVEKYPGDKSIPWFILSSVVSGQKSDIKTYYFNLLKTIAEEISIAEDKDKTKNKSANDTQNESTNERKNFSEYLKDKKDTVKLLDTRLSEQDLYFLANKFWKLLMPENKNEIWFRKQYLLLPFVAAFVALTQLLDFGEPLIEILSRNILFSPLLLLFSLSIPFVYMYKFKHKDLGLSITDSMKNISLPFGLSVLFSLICTLIWISTKHVLDSSIWWYQSPSQEGNLSFYNAFPLLFFFTVIIFVATKGAFTISKLND